jgi:hypothetical protein
MRARFSDRVSWIRLAWFSFGLLFFLGGRELFLRGMGTGRGEFLGYFSSKWGVGLIAFVIAGIGILGFTLSSILKPHRTKIWFDQLSRWLEGYPLLGWAIAAISILFPVVLLQGPWGWRFGQPTFRIMLLVLSGLVAGLFLPHRAGNFWIRWAVSTLAAATVLTITERFLLISDNPFPLGWSEGNRLWDYSLYFVRDRYAISGDFYYPTYLTPGRHGLWGLPFLFFPSISIQGMRIWDGILWTTPYLILGAVLFFRSKTNISTSWKLLLTLWSFLFISQGPIYSPLILAATILVWGYDAKKPWRSLSVTFLASLYAGLSRWTWMFAPAIWAGTLALLDEDVSQAFIHRLKLPVVLGVGGLLGALSSLLIMNFAFPRPDAIFSTSLSQPLLWDRLWSSATNPTGIVTGLVYALGPLFLFLIWVILSKYSKWDFLQNMILIIMITGFLAVGLAASVKIGGGSNLHNLDMLFVTLIILVGAIVSKKWDPSTFPPYILAILVIVWLMPIVNLSHTSQSIELPSWDLSRTGLNLDAPTDFDAVEALATIRFEVAAAAEKGEVLFLDQRQLLTFGEITGVPLVMDYELKHVMNQAMGHNDKYFEQFRRDIENHRFSLIVSDPLYIVFQGSKVPFGEDNDAWVEEVTIPILESYEPIERLDKVLVWLLAPIEEVEE